MVSRRISLRSTEELGCSQAKHIELTARSARPNLRGYFRIRIIAGEILHYLPIKSRLSEKLTQVAIETALDKEEAFQHSSAFNIVGEMASTHYSSN